MRRPLLALALVPVALVGLVASPATASRPVFPEEVPLPNGFRPEGVVASGTTFWVGSLADGAVYRGDVRTGGGAVLVPGTPGRVAVGLELDAGGRTLFVAGGPTGTAFVYDARSGQELAAIPLSGAPTFVNDVAVTRDAAWFTDSARASLYRVALDADGRPTSPPVVTTVPLGGDWQQVPGFNANGIDVTPDGSALFVVNSTVGELHRVDPDTGATTRVDLGGASLSNADGILLRGHTLYVVRNRLNEIVRIELAADGTTGRVVEQLTDPAFQVPTTVTIAAGSLYAVNARFGTPPTPDTTYTVVRVG